jgi:hypothetical protein
LGKNGTHGPPDDTSVAWEAGWLCQRPAGLAPAFGATRGLEEQRGERAIALSIALGQLSLKVGVDAVKIFQRSMDPRVVEVLYADV